MKSAFRPDDLMAILDGIDDAVVKLDAGANFTAMNQAAADIYQRLGFDPQRMKGKSIWHGCISPVAPMRNASPVFVIERLRKIRSWLQPA